MSEEKRLIDLRDKRIINSLSNDELRELESSVLKGTLFKGEELTSITLEIVKVDWFSDNVGNGNYPKNQWYTVVPYADAIIDYETFGVDLKACKAYLVGKDVRELTKKFDVADEEYFNDISHFHDIRFETSYMEWWMYKFSSLEEITNQSSGLVLYENNEMLIVNWSSIVGLPRLAPGGFAVLGLGEMLQIVDIHEVDNIGIFLEQLKGNINILYDVNNNISDLHEYSGKLYQVRTDSNNDVIIIAPEGWN